MAASSRIETYFVTEQRARLAYRREGSSYVARVQSVEVELSNLDGGTHTIESAVGQYELGQPVQLEITDPTVEVVGGGSTTRRLEA